MALLLAASLGVLAACSRADRAADAKARTVDTAVAARIALDTLEKIGGKDMVADSTVRRGDTLAVWTGPRVWMATDRPMWVIDVVSPARVVGIRHIPGG